MNQIFQNKSFSLLKSFVRLFFIVHLLNLLFLFLVIGFWDLGLYFGFPKTFYVINCGLVRGDYICPRGFNFFALIFDILFWSFIVVLAQIITGKTSVKIPEKGFPRFILLGSIIVLFLLSFFAFKRRPITSLTVQNTNEDIRDCVSSANYTSSFNVIFNEGVSKKDAELILKDNYSDEFRPNSESPNSYFFELPTNNICKPLEGIFIIKNVYKIPALYRQPEKFQPKNGPVNILSCPNIPSYFIIPNGYISNLSNNFYLTYYQNGNELIKELENLGAYNINSLVNNKISYNVSFQNGKICQSVNSLKVNSSVFKIENIPFMPGPPPLK